MAGEGHFVQGGGCATTLQSEPGVALRVAVGVLTVAAAACSAVHVFAALPDRKAAYERASRRHAAIRRRIEIARVRLATSGDSALIWQNVESIKEEMDSVAASSPNAAGRVWGQVKRQMKGEFTWRERIWAKFRGLPLSPTGLLPSIDGPRGRLADESRD